MKPFYLIALTSLIPGPALATPALLPTRDVSINYTLTSPGQSAQTIQLAYNAANELAQISSQYGYYVLVNLPAGQAQLIIPALNAVAQVPEFSDLAAEIFKAGNKAQFTALGQNTYAGLSCEMYQVTDRHGSAHTCLTHDGLILYFSGHDEDGDAEVTATSVVYESHPPQQFQVPAGLKPITLPPGTLKTLLNPP